MTDDHDHADLVRSLALWAALVLLFLLTACHRPVIVRPDCHACWYVTLSDSSYVLATHVSRTDGGWRASNVCTGEEWTFSGLEVSGVGKLDGCE